jgi:hypothetical protein
MMVMMVMMVCIRSSIVLYRYRSAVDCGFG